MMPITVCADEYCHEAQALRCVIRWREKVGNSTANSPLASFTTIHLEDG